MSLGIDCIFEALLILVLVICLEAVIALSLRTK